MLPGLIFKKHHLLLTEGPNPGLSRRTWKSDVDRFQSEDPADEVSHPRKKMFSFKFKTLKKNSTHSLNINTENNDTSSPMEELFSAERSSLGTFQTLSTVGTAVWSCCPRKTQEQFYSINTKLSTATCVHQDKTVL